LFVHSAQEILVFSMVRESLKNSVHTSSLYLLKMLTFLSSPQAQACPPTLQELQVLFEQDPDCAVTLSTDTLRLYMLALEESGCLLERPHASNQFGIKLHHHPYAIHFSIEEWIDVCEALDEQFSTTHIPSFLNAYNFVEHLITLPYFNASQKKNLSELLMGFLPSGNMGVVKQLVKDPSCSRLYFTHYQSKQKQHEWCLLHDAIVIVQRRLYWLCYRVTDEERLSPMMLRLDRCRSIRPLDVEGLGIDVHRAKCQIVDTLRDTEAFDLYVVMPKGMNVELQGLQHEVAEVLTPMQALNIPHIKEIEDFFERPCYVIDYSIASLHDFYIRSRLKSTSGFLIPKNKRTHALFVEDNVWGTSLV
jgi:hypothetical protein